MPLTLEAVEFPITIRPAHPVSDEELLRFGAANKGLRFEREKTGELVIMTPTGNRTGMKNMHISRALGNWTDEDGRGYAFDSSTGFSLPDGSMRSPDAAWVQRSRWDGLTEEQQDGFSPVCPEFVIELRSRSDNLDDLRAKMGDWIANGAELAWLVDPERKAVEVYRPGRAPEIQEGHSAVYGEGPVGGFVLELARIWS
ncbi:MAG TPA: Uma2 family endonuclease [Acidobacteriaceae bacterium]|jgi:Uma2 family endonuclease|nr:Uma2 family endonuclease [Acidobacteriaceae bacterium]